MSYCHFKRKIYVWYLSGTCIETICSEMDMNGTDVNEIIDYINESCH